MPLVDAPPVPVSAWEACSEEAIAAAEAADAAVTAASNVASGVGRGDAGEIGISADLSRRLFAPPPVDADAAPACALSVPAPRVLALLYAAPMLAAAQRLRSAASCALLLRGDLLHHCTALRQWMLLGDGGALDGVAAVLERGRAGTTSAREAVAAANAALAAARTDLGYDARLRTFHAEVISRAAEAGGPFLAAAAAAMAASAIAAADGNSRARPTLAANNGASGETLQEAIATARRALSLPPHIQYMHCFRYEPAGADSDGIIAVYDVTVAADDSASELLQRVLSPRALRRYARAHALLLALRGATASLAGLWTATMRARGRERGARTAAVGAGAAHAALVHGVSLFRHEAALLLRTLEEHLARQVAAGGSFASALATAPDAAASAAGIARAHDHFTASLVARCLLPSDDEGGAVEISRGDATQRSLFAAGARSLRRLLDLVSAAAAEGVAALSASASSADEHETLAAEAAAAAFSRHLQSLRIGVRALLAGVRRLAASSAAAAGAGIDYGADRSQESDHLDELAARLAAVAVTDGE